ncbi:MAG: RNA polymerase sigma factor [Armatimonadetes bacterium]|nr:RNA polymerase sigma factor [Armatimonadota bacterium]
MHAEQNPTTRDAAAFEAACAQWRGELQRLALGILRQPDTADDVVQEALLRLWTADPPPSTQGTRSWLLRVTTNLALNALRSARRRPADPVDPARLGLALAAGAGLAAGSQPPATPHQALVRAETDGLYRRALADLPPAQRQIVSLVYESEMRLRDVAEALGVPEGTVKSRLHAARAKLSRRWRELAPDWEDES